ncbi:MAG: hypothetical protein ACE15C_07000 [Phycisphaerae bacterium]
MDSERAAEELKIIRQLMERPIRCSTMSGYSGILAGCAALAGLAADSLICAYYAVGRGGESWQEPITSPRVAMWTNAVVWGCVFLVALAGTLGLTRLREIRSGMPFWSPVKRKLLRTILPPFVAGAGLTSAIMYRWYISDGPNEWGLIPPVWMLFYGVACWQVGEFSIRELRYMGAAFIVAGLLTAAFWQAHFPGLAPGEAPYLTLGATFGGFHIVYGIVVRIRHGG